MPELPAPRRGRVGWPWDPAPPTPPHLDLAAFPLVTLVTPSLNQGRFLEAAIRSVLLQDYPNLQYIVMDGGSKDGSHDILSKYSEFLEYWESGHDEGQSDAINRGWQRGAGRYLWWLNADDMLTPHSLHEAVAYLERYPETHLVYGDVEIVDEGGGVGGREHYQPFSLDNYIVDYGILPQPGALMRVEMLAEVGFLDASLHYIMDRDYYTRLALAGCRLDYHPRVLARGRAHPEAKTQAGSPAAVRERIVWLKKALEHPDLPASVKQRSRLAWSNLHLVNARICMKFGGYHEAVDRLWRSFRTRPAQALRSIFWANMILSLLGLLLGHHRTQRLRSVLRNLRLSTGRDDG